MGSSLCSMLIVYSNECYDVSKSYRTTRSSST